MYNSVWSHNLLKTQAKFKIKSFRRKNASFEISYDNNVNLAHVNLYLFNDYVVIPVQFSSCLANQGSGWVGSVIPSTHYIKK
jgi:hypothetical protein